MSYGVHCCKVQPCSRHCSAELLGSTSQVCGTAVSVARALPQEFESLAAGMAGREIGRYRLFTHLVHERGETDFPPRPPRGAEAILAFAALERAEVQAQAAADHRLATYACSCRLCQAQRVSRGLPAVREEPEAGRADSPRAAGQPGGAAAEGGKAARARPHRLVGAGEPGEPGERAREGARGAGAAQEAQAAGGGAGQGGGAASGAGATGDGPGSPCEVRPGLQSPCAVSQARAGAFASGQHL